MIKAKNLIEILKTIDGEAEVTVYEGEDTGINIYDKKNKVRLWIRAKESEEEDEYVERHEIK